MRTVPLHVAALVLYLLASVFYGAYLSLRTQRAIRIGRVSALFAVTVHTFAIGAFCLSTGQSPLDTQFGTLSATAWFTALIFLSAETLIRVPSLGALGGPICSLLLFGGLLHSPSVVRVTPELRNTIIRIHVPLAIISAAVFAVAGCCAVFYLWQYSVLKRPDRRGRFRSLPPLRTIDGFAMKLVGVGLPMLSLALALGIVRAIAGGLPGNWVTDPHTVLSFAAWALYTAFLVGRVGFGWRVSRSHYLLVVAFALVVALFFVPATTHHFS